MPDQTEKRDSRSAPRKTLNSKTPINENNLARTIELIDLCFKLKEAYLRRQHPEASPEKIRDLIDQGILARKEQQWASPEICSRP